jgi:Asp-tRNA(Asn)/Glu-tRNA(Gln) amidotransferase A subunit family amidase
MPTPESRSYLTAHAAFRAGSDTPRDFLERCIAAMGAWEPRIQAFVSTNLDGARAAADQATGRWRAGNPLSPIDGMPIGIKDVIETADMPTEQGSPLFKGWRGGRDSASVAALRRAGAVIVGKTVTTEFAALAPGPTRNPWDPSRTPGGSSSGSAAAVATGMVSAALGTQVIGSIIRPASYCGCYGFKPSVGALNRGGSFDHLSQSCQGALAASLQELWVVPREIASRAGGDPGFPGLSGPREMPAARRPAAIAVLQTDGKAAVEAADAFASVQERFARQGIRLLTGDDTPAVAAVEDAIRDATTVARRINAWETLWPLNTYARDMDAQGLSESMRARLADAETMTPDDYRQLLEERRRRRAVYAGLAPVAEACITLAAPGPAPVGLASTGDPSFAVPASLLGVPALSLPLLSAGGLPLGLQVIGFETRDADLFAVAAGLQALG